MSYFPWVGYITLESVRIDYILLEQQKNLYSLWLKTTPVYVLLMFHVHHRSLETPVHCNHSGMRSNGTASLHVRGKSRL